MTLVLGFNALDDPSMIGLILKIAAYTYGPLLGLFAFGVLSRREVRDPWTPAVALGAPLLCWLIDANQQWLFGGWQLGLELLVLIGVLTFAGLWVRSRSGAGQLNRVPSIPILDHRRNRWTFTLGCATVTAGVLLHLPMFWMGQDNGFRLAEMPMDAGMWWGHAAACCRARQRRPTRIANSSSRHLRTRRWALCNAA